MTDFATDSKIEPASAELKTVSQSVGSFLMSIVFWSAMLVSAMMYASVALSPKLADWISVRQLHAANAVRLNELEDEVDYLERVAAALKTDPEFANRLVDATQSGKSQNEFMPVSNSLKFGGDETNSTRLKPLVQPAISKIVFHLASHQSHRSWLLCCAAGLTILAFTLLNDSGIGILQSALSSLGSVLQVFLNRYRSETPEPSDASVVIDNS